MCIKKRKIGLFLAIGMIIFMTGCNVMSKSDMVTDNSQTSKPSENSNAVQMLPKNSDIIIEANTSVNSSNNIKEKTTQQSNSSELTSGGNTNEYTITNNKKKYTSSYIYNIRQKKEETIAKKILSEYKDTLLRLDKEFSYYDLAVATIRKNMMDNFLYNDDDISWLNNVPNANDYLSKSPKYSPVFSALSLDDILFITVAQPMEKDTYKYKNATDQLCNSKDELEFLEGFKNLANSKGYYALDVYVEDLLKLNRSIKLKGIRFTQDGSFKLEDSFHNLKNKPDDIALEKYLNKYKREVNYGNELHEGKWNLFLFDKKEVQPFSILIEFNSCDEQMVELTNISK